ncbi:DegT/DnrJ/EryC1/StrS family aminotransferase [Belliella sp. DSM 111904]|uniref:DegT/DnrJ/EryC1/StrS family aminotransferase n=1 Tax=Belliella filtrata TaxID=2923435 RepID=A0ABS9UWV3_9BACT|nr:DegT/DnrJ/EryC1/StrS family aminotransferase [Belliella filtrata]MCH7408642.1 DegT/DnrJ/EryC1/StrS family aminotransferase [Belliella filtrata]
MIPVTQPFLPPRIEYEEYLEGIWQRNWLTNDGELVRELETKLKEILQVSNMLFVANGTLALQLAIKALGIKGEVLTTPFSYVATTSSIVWEGCTPIFVDILPDYTIDPKLIEEAITPKTSAILATHVYGIPCQVEEIQRIADKHNLKVIYDGAHAFGVKVKGKSIFEYGDISTCSFHATKLYQTIEGGAVFTKDKSLFKKLGYLRNFGHDGFDRFNGVGINAKNSEFHAAMGLANLKYLEEIMLKRKDQFMFYHKRLSHLAVSLILLENLTSFNYSYFPIQFQSEEELLKVKAKLEDNKIGSRRYFYPSLNKLDYVAGQVPLAESISKRVLCIPLFHALTYPDQQFICDLLTESLK